MDGFLLLYAVNPKTGSLRLHSSNKCSNVLSVSWVGNHVVTAGPRHVKIWRTDSSQPASPSKGRLDLENAASNTLGSPGPRAFSGRNCLLGPLLDKSFASITAISSSQALLCTLDGDLCILEDSESGPKIEKILSVGFEVYCSFFDAANNLLWIGGSHCRVQALDVGPLFSSTKPSRPPKLVLDLRISQNETAKSHHVLAIGSVRGSLVFIDSERHLSVKRLERHDAGCELKEDHKTLPAHGNAVLGACEIPDRSSWWTADFLTYSSDGVVLLWRFSGDFCWRFDLLALCDGSAEQESDNELKALTVLTKPKALVFGDKAGTLRLVSYP